MQQNILNCNGSLCHILYILNFPSFQHHMTWPPPPGLWVNSDMVWVIYKRTWFVYLPLEEEYSRQTDHVPLDFVGPSSLSCNHGQSQLTRRFSATDMM